MNRYLVLMAMLLMGAGWVRGADRQSPVSPTTYQRRLKALEERLNILGKNYIKVTDLDKADNREKLNQEIEKLQKEKEEIMAKLAMVIDESQIEVGFYLDRTKIPVNEKAQTLLGMFDVTEYPPDIIGMRERDELAEQARASSEESSPQSNDSLSDSDDEDLEFAADNDGTKQEVLEQQKKLFHSILTTGSPVMVSKLRAMPQVKTKKPQRVEDDALIFEFDDFPTRKPKQESKRLRNESAGKISPHAVKHTAKLYTKARFGSSV